MAALTQIYWDWSTGIDGYGRNPGIQCNAYSSDAYPVGITSGGTTVSANCIYGSGGNTRIQAVVTCPAETIPDFNSGYCVPYLTSNLYLDAIAAIQAVPSNGGDATGSGFALPDMTVSEGLVIGMAIALAWAGAWGFRQIAKAFFNNEISHD